MRQAFTLIELLIVVAIIAILAAIAVPNFLEAQVRAKVSRVRNDLRATATAVEAYRVDNNSYPEGTDNPANYDPRVAEFLIPYNLQNGYYGFRVRGAGGLIVGRDFYGLTTPIAYISTVPTDPFARNAAAFWTLCYRNCKLRKNGYVLTSVGPDGDQLGLNNTGRGNTNTGNPVSTAVDPEIPRLGDVNEKMAVLLMEHAPVAPATLDDVPKLRLLLDDLSYDPTNGTVSDGDLVRIGP